jgi:hypothetical protein
MESHHLKLYRFEKISSSMGTSTLAACGTDESDARGNCRQTCASSVDCEAGQACWSVHSNYCGSKPQPNECNKAANGGSRCGISELIARETCGSSCNSNTDCDGGEGELCYPVQLNMCDCDARMLRGGKK